MECSYLPILSSDGGPQEAQEMGKRAAGTANNKERRAKEAKRTTKGGQDAEGHNTRAQEAKQDAEKHNTRAEKATKDAIAHKIRAMKAKGTTTSGQSAERREQDSGPRGPSVNRTSAPQPWGHRPTSPSPSSSPPVWAGQSEHGAIIQGRGEEGRWSMTTMPPGTTREGEEKEDVRNRTKSPQQQMREYHRGHFAVSPKGEAEVGPREGAEEPPDQAEERKHRELMQHGNKTEDGARRISIAEHLNLDTTNAAEVESDWNGSQKQLHLRPRSIEALYNVFLYGFHFNNNAILPAEVEWHETTVEEMGKLVQFYKQDTS